MVEGEIPRMLRIFFKYSRRLLGELCLSVHRSLVCYFEVVSGSELRPGMIADIQNGDRGGVDEAGQSSSLKIGHWTCDPSPFPL